MTYRDLEDEKRYDVEVDLDQIEIKEAKNLKDLRKIQLRIKNKFY